VHSSSVVPGCLITISYLSSSNFLLEMFLCFFQQFYLLADVSKARCIDLFLDPWSALAPHDIKLNHLRAKLLTVLRVVYAIVFGLVQASSILHVDLISCPYP